MLTHSSNKAGAAHIAFNASSPEVVDKFFAAALTAGGQVHDGPRVRDAKIGYYSAAVIDLDGNAIECVYRDSDCHTSAVSTARDLSAISSPSRIPEKLGISDESKRLPLQTIVNNTITTNTTSSPSPPLPTSNSNDCSKALVGTLLGAAAGAAIAYAMVKSEELDPPKRPETQHSKTMYQTIEAPPTPRSRRYSGSEISSPRISRHTYIRMLEAPPSPPSAASSQRTIRGPSMRAIQVPPVPSVISQKSRTSLAPTEPSRALPLGPTTQTINIERARSQAPRSSRASGRSGVRSVVATSRVFTAADVPLPKSPNLSAILKTPSDFPLPKSAYDLPISIEPQSRRRGSGTVSRAPKDISLPSSSHAFLASRAMLAPSHHTHSKSRFSRAPEEYALPPSTKTSAMGSRRSRRSSHPKAPEFYPLPTSAKTSFVSRPPSLSHTVVPASTVRVTRPRIEKAATDVDDMESLCPSDSISQVSSKGRRRRHRKVESSGEGRSRLSTRG